MGRAIALSGLGAVGRGLSGAFVVLVELVNALLELGGGVDGVEVGCYAGTGSRGWVFGVKTATLDLADLRGGVDSGGVV